MEIKESRNKRKKDIRAEKLRKQAELNTDVETRLKSAGNEVSPENVDITKSITALAIANCIDNSVTEGKTGAELPAEHNKPVSLPLPLPLPLQEGKVEKEEKEDKEDKKEDEKEQRKQYFLQCTYRTSLFAVPDIFYRGEMLWPKGVGLDCCFVGVMFLKMVAQAKGIIDPFAGQVMINNLYSLFFIL